METKRKEGWAQFLQNKIEMLNLYKIAKAKENNRPTKTEHGNVAEAEFRKWLCTFLPKRYGVTSGYIITQANLENKKITHFDTIIYDQINCPILWIDNNPDKSEQGKSKAIPVEYVHGVLEIKSKINAESLASGLSKLDELKPLLSKIDHDSEKYKMFLPKNFFSSLVFFEIDKKQEFCKNLLNKLIYTERGFYGAVILSAEELSENYTGIIKLTESEKEQYSNVGDGKNSLVGPGIKTTENMVIGACLSDSIKIGNTYLGTILFWSESNFSQFAFDFLALVNGTYENGRLSSFYGTGFGIQTP